MSRADARTGRDSLLTAGSVLDYLVDCRVLAEPLGTVEPLGGGVSADAFAVHSDSGSWVLKQALSQLKVAVEWHADPTRILNEAAALRVVGNLLPQSVPAVTMVDPDRLILVMQHAPERLRDWKAELMAGGSTSSAITASRLGTILATLHAHTLDDPAIRNQFDDIDSFVELRIDPFHRTVAARLPEIASHLDELAQHLVEDRRCLVHGDYSPKNILAAGADVWVIDWEVAHFGAPVFDLAFMLAHLMCKTVHRPIGSETYYSCARAFLASYSDEVGPALRPDASALIRHTAAVVLARTDGKSPAGYLTPRECEHARAHAIALLGHRTTDHDVTQQLWSELT